MAEPAQGLIKPQTAKRLRRGFYVLLGLFLILDFFVHKHSAFAWEEVPDFYAAYGLAACVFLVFAAKGLRRLLMRDEDYYDT
ncbi:MAG: hypothetical protein PVG60_05190 [Desulfarculaceae bacterium]|jgi:hypothetical protein